MLGRGRREVRGWVAVVLATPWVVVGCDPGERELSSEVVYSEPAEPTVASSRTVPRALPQVWQAVVAAADRAPYEVVAENESAGFVVVGFDPAATGLPVTAFVDCGRIERSVVAEGESTTFAYALGEAGADREVTASPEGYVVRDLERTPALETRSTLHLAAQDPERTRITVNARYTVTIDTTGQEVHWPRRRSLDAGPPEPFGPDTIEARFKSFEAGRFEEDGPYLCRSTGELERRLLSLASAQASADPEG